MAEDRLRWYRAARFGLLIHWGPYSVAGVEASWQIMAPDLAAVAFGVQQPISVLAIQLETTETRSA